MLMKEIMIRTIIRINKWLPSLLTVGILFYQLGGNQNTPDGRDEPSLDYLRETYFEQNSIDFGDYYALNRLKHAPEVPATTLPPKKDVSSADVASDDASANDVNCNHDSFYREPEIKLDPEHFLIPILEWGPNNQLRGFMESMYIAIQLNRTLIIPPFFKHRTDTTVLSHEEQYALHPTKRIDPYLVSKYMSAAEDYDMKRLCNGKVNAVFKARQDCNEYTVGRIKHFLSYTGMDPFYDDTCSPIDSDLKVSPENENHPAVPINRDGIMNLYGNREARCAILLFPFMSISSFESKINSAIRWYPNMGQQEEYIYNIIKHVQRPESQRKFVQKFIIDKMNGKPYIAIHWRFDKNDWQIHCATKESNYYCDTVTSIYNDLNKTKIAFRKYINMVKVKSDVQAVYFAAPPEENILRLVVKEIVGEDDRLFMFDASDIRSLVEESECVDELDLFDAISSIEQEFCYESEIFLYSKISSWSKNVLLQRYVHRDRTERNIMNFNAFI